MKTIDQNSLTEMSVAELRELNKTILTILEKKKQDMAFFTKLTMSEGDVVSVNDKQFKGSVFEVIKLNPKRAKLRRDNGEVWNVQYSLITYE